MTTVHDIDLPTVLADRLTSASPDVLREMLALFIHTLMGPKLMRCVGGLRPAQRGAHQLPQRVSAPPIRHPHRHIDLAIPKLRAGSYFPDWLLERGKRAERALTTVVATCYLLGVSTRRMDRLVETLGITGLSKSQVSVMAKANSMPRSRRSAPARSMPARTPSWADALVLKRCVKAGGWSTCMP